MKLTKPMKKRAFERIVTDFLIGGVFVSMAVAIGIAVGAVYGGIIAALPIRLGITILVSSIEGEAFTRDMIEGALLSYIGILFFLLTLYYGFPRLGLIKSFAIATIVASITILIVFKLAGKF